MLTTSGDNLSGVLATSVVALAVAAVPPFLAGTRDLEIAAARSLLGVALPERARGTRLPVETRVRAALWFGLHLLTGVVVGAAVLVAVPLALLAFTERLGITRGALAGLGPAELGPAGRWWWTLIGIGLLLATVYATAGLGALAAAMAPVLLGPSPAERLAAVEARERELAERNRLARELHDSVGHALTAATLQASAARAVFDRDPAFARQALATIEEVGRTALEELDAVLGALRETDTGRPGQSTLDDLDRLLTAEIQADVRIGAVPAPVSREAFRIVQEALTNAAKHGAGRTRLTVTGTDRLIIEVTNRMSERPGTSGGRGLAGIRERVRLLGGELTAGPEGGVFSVVATLPLERR